VRDHASHIFTKNRTNFLSVSPKNAVTCSSRHDQRQQKFLFLAEKFFVSELRGLNRVEELSQTVPDEKFLKFFGSRSYRVEKSSYPSPEFRKWSKTTSRLYYKEYNRRDRNPAINHRRYIHSAPSPSAEVTASLQFSPAPVSSLEDRSRAFLFRKSSS
jgi:hypothetical protein